MTDKSPAGPSQTPAGSFEARRHKDSSQVAPTAISAFSNLNRQVASSRRRATRVLARQRLRRRVVPPLIVGSTVLLGGGLSAAWVNGTLRATPLAATSEVRASPAWVKASAKAQAVELQALDHVRQALAADSQMISSLSRAARQALLTNNKTTVIHQSESIAGSSSATSAPILSSGASSGASSGGNLGGGPGASTGGLSGGLGSASLPALPPLPPMPSINVPTTQGTTGASHVVK